MSDRIMYANTTTSVRYGERIVRIAQGDPWWADDEFVKARPELFSDIPLHVFGARGVTVTAEKPIEAGTRRPGEKRATRRG